MKLFTREELIELTGKKSLSAQCSVLARRGIPFRFIGSAIELSHEVAMAFRPDDMRPGPMRRGVDFSKVR